MLAKIVLIIIFTILVTSSIKASEVNLTCHTDFINNKPSNNKIPIWYAKVNYAKNHIDWSDVDNSAKRKFKLSQESIVVYADTSVALKKYVNINRVNGTFTYLKPNVLSNGKLYGFIKYEGRCSVGIKKKLF
tara:strand:+ start:223 stop:618 length:396 start_codon:yes stop_codon:yes gene_type:complete